MGDIHNHSRGIDNCYTCAPRERSTAAVAVAENRETLGLPPRNSPLVQQLESARDTAERTSRALLRIDKERIPQSEKRSLNEAIEENLNCLIAINTATGWVQS